MENASKALIMAASVLLGIMIISIGVFLFSMYADFSSESYGRMETAKIDQFNSQFLKYYGSTMIEGTNKPQPIKCTIHDIISLANFAKYNNEEYDIANEIGASDATQYIQIEIKKNYKNVEKLNEKDKLELIRKYDGYEYDATKDEIMYIEFICTDVKFNSTTKKVNYMCFEKAK